MNKPKLSVIIVNYKTTKMVVNLIRSIAKETIAKQIETIVVDNESTEESAKVLTQIISAGFNTKLIKNKGNLGFAKAVNQGLEKSRGKYKLLLNSDVKLIKGSLEKLMDYVDTEENVGVVGMRLLMENERKVQPSCYQFPTISRAVQQYIRKDGKPLDKFFPAGSEPSEVEAVVGAAFLITPDALKTAGVLDDRYFMYFEDIDYCRKVKKAGLKVIYHPQAKVVHFHGASGKGQEGVQRNRLVESSKIYHGLVGHYVLNFIIWFGQKWQKSLKIF